MPIMRESVEGHLNKVLKAQEALAIKEALKAREVPFNTVVDEIENTMIESDAILETQQVDLEEELPVAKAPKAVPEKSEPQKVVKSKKGDGNLLCLFSEKCLECAYLVAHCTDFQKADKAQCHFSEGNHLCPAQFTRIAVAPDFEVASSGLAEAQATEDSERILRAMRRLSKYDAAVSKEIMRRANKKWSVLQREKEKAEEEEEEEGQ